MEYSGKENIEKLGSHDSCYITNFCKNPNEVFNELNEEIEFIPREELKFKIYGKELPLPRDKQFFGDIDKEGRIPLFRYTKDYIPVVKKWTDTLKEIRDQIEEGFMLNKEKKSQYCNHLVVNRYQDGSEVL